jgi:hypothetical protein
MPKIPWNNLPQGIRHQHLIDRLHDRAIDLSDLNQLRRWIDTSPEVPEGDWHKDFGSFKLCGRGALAKTFLLRDQIARGQEV